MGPSVTSVAQNLLLPLLLLAAMLLLLLPFISAFARALCRRHHFSSPLHEFGLGVARLEMRKSWWRRSELPPHNAQNNQRLPYLSHTYTTSRGGRSRELWNAREIGGLFCIGRSGWQSLAAARLIMFRANSITGDFLLPLELASGGEHHTKAASQTLAEARRGRCRRREAPCPSVPRRRLCLQPPRAPQSRERAATERAGSGTHTAFGVSR